MSNLSHLIYKGKKCAYCPSFGDWAISAGLKRDKKKGIAGDIILFDWNGNGDSDHVGLIVDTYVGGYWTIEGNTSSTMKGSQDNGGGVYKRQRSYSGVNYIVRVPYENESQRTALLAKAKSQIGYTESPKNSNKTKYGKWYGVDGQPWCLIFIMWLFGNTENPKPIPIKTNKKAKYTGEFPNFITNSRWIVNNFARECAWKNGTAKSKYAYLGGKAMDKFATTLKKVYPDRTTWSDRPRKGASCDVFVGTVVRGSGMASKYPRGLAEQMDYFGEGFKKISDISKVKAGDVVRYTKPGAGHTFVAVDIGGTLYRAEANYGVKGMDHSFYGHTSTKVGKLKKSDYKHIDVLRVSKAIRKDLREGDRGTEVEKLKAFLRWFGATGMSKDDYYGKGTVSAVKKFQKAVGIKQTGVFDNNTRTKAKAYKK